MPRSYICPVCGYPDLDTPSRMGEICPSCGVEFGYDDDLGVSYEDLRNRWLERGAPWFSRATHPPPQWNALNQLEAVGLTSSTVGAVELLEFTDAVSTVEMSAGFVIHSVVASFDVKELRIGPMPLKRTGLVVLNEAPWKASPDNADSFMPALALSY